MNVSSSVNALVESMFRDYSFRMRNIERELINKGEVKTREKRGAVYEAYQYETVDAIKQIMDVHGPDAALQFIRRMLRPNIERNKYSLYRSSGMVIRRGASFSNFCLWDSVINRNFYETTALNFLEKARNGEIADISAELGKSWHEHIMHEHKKALLLEFNEKAMNDYKTGQYVEFESYFSEMRPERSNNLIAPVSTPPEFLKTGGLNEAAKSIMIEYFTGERSLNPVEVYNLSGSLQPGFMGRSHENKYHAIEKLWEGAERRTFGHNNIFASKGHTFRENIKLGAETLKKGTAKEIMKDRLLDCVK